MIPQAVSDGGEGYKSLSLTTLIPYMVKAAQEQEAQIKALQTELQSLRGKNAALKDLVCGDHPQAPLCRK